jgi:hypothetical protein
MLSWTTTVNPASQYSSATVAESYRKAGGERRQQLKWLYIP